MFLASESEIKDILKELNIRKYYIEIDLNGAMAVSLSPEYSDKKKELEESLLKNDSKRTPDDIYKLKEVLFPVKRILIDEDEDEYTIASLKENRITYSRYSQQLNTWKNSQIKESEGEDRPPRVTFYSYKGGVGRSTSLAIVARLLAKNGLKVAVIDLDLEAPGLNSLLLTRPKTAPFGVVDYLYQAPWIRENIDSKRFTSQYVVREDVPRKNDTPGQLIVISAGGTIVKSVNNKINLLFDEEDVEIGLDPNYVKKLSYIDFDVYARQSQNIFEELLEDLANYTEADIILMDARTGISSVSGELLNHCSDYISFHVQDNRQNREGIDFILKNLSPNKVGNIIWSHTKMPRDYQKEHSDFPGYIRKISEKNGYENEFYESNLCYLPHDSGLEDITASELKTFIDSRGKTVLLSYERLTEKIMNVTKINKKPFSYIEKSKKEEIIASLLNITKESSPSTPYITQRFLSEDLTMFIGFPGSGKTTFHSFMEQNGRKDIQVISYEEFRRLNPGAHQTMSSSTFLGWNLQEAMQAACKWLLSSEELYNWIQQDEIFMKKTSVAQLKEMRENPQYELDDDVVKEILDFIFEGNQKLIDGFWLLFFSLQYRNRYVLPKDMMQGISLFFKYCVEKNFHADSRSLFPVDIALSPHSKEIWREIGEEKANWLKAIDAEVYKLAVTYLKVIQKIDMGDMVPYQEVREQLKLSLNLSEKDFESLLTRAFDMEIFDIQKGWISAKEMTEHLYLSPVYRYIPVQK